MQSSERMSLWQSSLLVLFACVMTTVLATPLLGYLDLANIVMLFLLLVQVIALTLGRAPAVLASLLSVILFDVFFVPPRFSLAVSNIQYLITFAVMLATALITGQLVAILQQRAREAAARERQTRDLYSLARDLAGVTDLAQAGEAVAAFLRSRLQAGTCILLEEDMKPGAHDSVPGCQVDRQLAHMVFAAGSPLHASEPAADAASLYLPLQSSGQVRGVLAVSGAAVHDEAATALLEAVASLLAVTIERLHYVGVIHAGELDMASERLRSSILSSLSHDLRTPLTALVGLADALFLRQSDVSTPDRETAQAIREQATRLTGMVSNLLDMARLNAGHVTLRREWQPLDEVVGSSIKLLEMALQEHPIKVSLADDLPLLALDAVLLERVFCNLLENAGKYAPAGSVIDIAAVVRGDQVEVSVADRGPGFPAGDRKGLFDMFVRGQPESTGHGTGLGLAICRAIVEAHGGAIAIEDRPGGGAVVLFTLPRGEPPCLPEEEA